jgi:hypothetical protein
MASIFKDIGQVTVNGSNKYLNGYIYDVNYQPSIGAGPSRLTISLVNEDGNYANPSLTVKQASQINIGSLGLNMYPVKYTKKESSQGKILQVEFSDGSFILDKIYVGLIKKHWNIDPKNIKTDKFKRRIDTYYQKFTIDKNFIILGRELHPCDVNKDGVLNFNEVKATDPCDPCVNCPTDKYDKEDRCSQLSYLKVFDVAYTFDELIDGANAIAGSTGVQFNIEMPKGLDKGKLKKYLKDYTGSLKTVLDQWCSDLGLALVFDASGGKFFFRDITKDIKLNESAITSIVNDPNVKIISKDVEESMENTTSRGAMSLYERNGEKRNYPCEKSQSLVVPIVTDFDFLGAAPNSAYIANGDEKIIDYKTYTTSAVLGRYSEEMREAFWIRDIYEIKDAASARAFKSEFKLGLGSAGRLSGFFEGIQRKIPEMGDFTIIQVVQNTGDLGAEAVGKLSEEDKLACQQYNYLTSRISDSITKNDFTKNKGFFVVAYQDKELYEKRLNFEKKVFESFGRFYIREGFIKLCGITGSPEFITQNTNLYAGDGNNPTFIPRGFDINNLPFSKYPFETTSYLGCMVYPFVSNPGIGGAKGQTNAPKASPFQKYETDEREKDEGVPKPYFGPAIICIEREPHWSPKEPDTVGEFKETFAKYKTLSLAEYGAGGKGGVGASAIPPGLTEILGVVETVTEENNPDPLPGNIKVFTMIPGVANFLWEYNSEDHPTERTAMEANPRIRNDRANIPGLMNKTCSVLTIDKYFKIYAPPLSLLEEPEAGNLNNDNPCDDYIKNRTPAMRVLITQNFTQKKELGKIQYLKSNVSNPLGEDTYKFELNYLNITNNDFDILDVYCSPDQGALDKIHEEYNLRTTDSILTNLKKISYKLKGIPQLNLKKALELGLEQLNFTYSSDGGVCSLSFGNSFAVRPSVEVIRAGLAYNRTQTNPPETSTTIK